MPFTRAQGAAHGDSRGQAESAFDVYGRETRTVYSDAGSPKKVIENYTDGDPSTGNSDEDMVTEYEFVGPLLSKVTTTTKKAGQSGTDVQSTTYVYGTSVDDASPAVYRNDLVRAVIYADSDDTFNPQSRTLSSGTDATYDRVEYKYNRQGEVVEVKGQNGTTHQYAFDKLGRETSDRATALGANVDGSVRRVDTEYTVRGEVESVTAYDDPDPGEGSAVNQAYYTYNDWGLLAREYQEHEGVKDANTLYVQYNYADAEDGLRLESVRYPNGRLVHYTYGSSGGANDNLNRLAAICDDDSGTPGQVVAAYEYLGLDRIITEDYAQAEVKLDLFGGTSGTYAGLDAFGRVVDQVWKDYGAHPDAVIDEFLYGYDRLGNPTWKKNAVAESNNVDVDELYAYDEVYRLIGVQRGDLNGSHDALENGTKNFEQDWSLDGLGNWSQFDEDADGDGTADLEQNRAVNGANEITDVTEEQGQEAWVTPVYDRAGNMTTLPKPSNPDVALTAIYDAWNRLVEVKEGADTVAHYEYDGLGRLVVQATDTSSPIDPDGTLDVYTHHFYTGVQQIETRDSLTSGAQAENLQPHYQYVWSARYVDAAVLRDENTDADGTCDDGRLYYLSDANHNATALVDSTGAVQERYVYDPHGKVTIYDDDWSDTRQTSAESNTHLYTGRQLDPATGLYYHRARWYDTNLGKFINRDPAQTDPNLYRYCRNHPLSSTDPSGLEEWLDDDGFWWLNSGGWWVYIGVERWDSAGKETFAAGPDLPTGNHPSWDRELVAVWYKPWTWWKGIGQSIGNGIGGCNNVDKSVKAQQQRWERMGRGTFNDSDFTAERYGYDENTTAAIDGLATAAVVWDSSAGMWVTRTNPQFAGPSRFGPVAKGPAGRGVWDLHPFQRGGVIEQQLGKNLPGNFPTIDRFQNGTATSIKSMDMAAPTYANPANIGSKGRGYIDSVAGFQGKNWGHMQIGTPYGGPPITARGLDLAVSPGATTAQQQALNDLVTYGGQCLGSVFKWNSSGRFCERVPLLLRGLLFSSARLVLPGETESGNAGEQPDKG